MTELELLKKLKSLTDAYMSDIDWILRALADIRGFYAEPSMKLEEREKGADCAEARQFSWAEPDGDA